MKTIWKMVPGLAMALVIAAAAKGLEYLEGLAGLHLIGASVIALFIGMVINRFFKPNAVTSPGIRFTSKKVLKLAIILLGASLNIMTVLKVGRFSLTVMLFTLATCFGVGYFIGKALGLNWKMSNLISAGTGICGGSAIAAIAPVGCRRGLRHVRDVPVRHGDDRAVPDPRPLARPVRCGLRPLGRNGRERHIERCGGGLCLQRAGG